MWQCHAWYIKTKYKEDISAALKIDPTLEDTFQQTIILAFPGNWNLKDIIGSIKMEFNNVKQKSLTIAKGKCRPYLSNKGTLCCTKIIKMTMFQSNQNQITYPI